MLKRALPKTPRVFVLKTKYGAPAADAQKPVASSAVFEPPGTRAVEVVPARGQVVQPRVGRVRMQAAGPRAS